jgi:hypothetical protein
MGLCAFQKRSCTTIQQVGRENINNIIIHNGSSVLGVCHHRNTAPTSLDEESSTFTLFPLYIIIINSSSDSNSSNSLHINSSPNNRYLVWSHRFSSSHQSYQSSSISINRVTKATATTAQEEEEQ